MSRSRRILHRALVADQRRLTYLDRRTQECRSTHWRLILATLAATEWRRPEHQDAIVATVHARCPHHRRTSLYCTAVISRIEVAPTQDLRPLQHQRLQEARFTITRLLVPRRARREFHSAPIEMPA